VQVVHIKPVLKAPGYILLKLRYDEQLSNFGFNFNLRRYSKTSLQRQTFVAVVKFALETFSNRWVGARSLISQPQRFLVTEPLKSPSVDLKRCLR